MCRNNFFFLVLYIAVSIFAGLLLANYIIDLLNVFELLPVLILNFVCVVIFALFLLPGLNAVIK